MSFGENVKRLRQQKQMTQAELAQVLGVTQAAVSSIESNIRVSNVYLALKIAQTLDVEPRELVA